MAHKIRTHPARFHVAERCPGAGQRARDAIAAPRDVRATAIWRMSSAGRDGSEFGLRKIAQPRGRVIGRRANVLLSGGRGSRDLGQRVRLGEALVGIRGITSPCPVMDRAAPGRQQVLRPEGRSGIWGRVLEDGRVRCGDGFMVEVAAGGP